MVCCAPIANMFVVCCRRHRQIEMSARYDRCSANQIHYSVHVIPKWQPSRPEFFTDRWPHSDDYCDEWSTPQCIVAHQCGVILKLSVKMCRRCQHANKIMMCYQFKM
jgi:hypothetical protein